MPLIHTGKRGKRYWLNLFAFTLFLLFLVYILVIPAMDAWSAMHPARFPVGPVSPADLGMHYSDVTLNTEDGLTLRGWYVPSANRAAVILVHAFNGNRTGMLNHAQLLAGRGYGVLLYDTRAQGESEGDLYAFGWDAHLDVFAALEYLQTRPDVDPQRIGALGLSAGAKAVLYAASEDKRISAVVAEGCGYPTFSDWYSGTDAADRLWAPSMGVTFLIAETASGIWNPPSMADTMPRISPTPVLLIAAGRDARFNRKYYDAALRPKESWFRDEAGHIDALFAHPAEYEERVVGFFDRNLFPDAVAR
jgi:dienelactone hydrolase